MIGTELEVEEVHHVSEPQAVGDIPQDPGEQESPPIGHQGACKMAPHENQAHEHGGRKEDEEEIAVVQHSERSTRIVNMCQAEESRNHDDRVLKWYRMNNPDLCGLIDQKTTADQNPKSYPIHLITSHYPGLIP